MKKTVLVLALISSIIVNGIVCVHATDENNLSLGTSAIALINTDRTTGLNNNKIGTSYASKMGNPDSPSSMNVYQVINMSGFTDNEQDIKRLFMKFDLSGLFAYDVQNAKIWIDSKCVGQPSANINIYSADDILFSDQSTLLASYPSWSDIESRISTNPIATYKRAYGAQAVSYKEIDISDYILSRIDDGFDSATIMLDYVPTAYYNSYCMYIASGGDYKPKLNASVVEVPSNIQVTDINIKDADGLIQKDFNSISKYSKTISVSFDSRMNKATISQDTIYLEDIETGDKVSADYTYSDGVIKMVLKEQLKADRMYRLFISTNVKSRFGTGLEEDNTILLKTQEDHLKIRIKKAEITQDDKLNVSVECDCKDADAGRFTVLGGLYKDGKLVRFVKLDDVDFDEDDQIITDNYTVDLDCDIDSCKIYVWNSLGLFKPLCNSVLSSELLLLNKVDDDIDYHTLLMLQYFSDDVESIDKYVTGYDALDAPNPVNLSWSVNKTDYSSGNFTVKISENPDMTDCWQYVTSNNNIDVYNLKVGTRYYWTVTYGDYTSGASTFTTASTAPRNLKIGGIKNIRDVGGWKTNDGVVKQGKLFRTYRLNYYSSSGSIVNAITSSGISTLRNDMKIKTEIDLRLMSELSEDFTESALGSDINYYITPLNYTDDYLDEGNKQSIKSIFDILAKEENYPIIYHCSAGADRTGMITYLINGLLGVSKEDLQRDYLLTNFAKLDKLRTLALINNKYVKVLDEYEGENLSEKIFNYLRDEVGVAEDDLNFIKAYLVD